MWSRLQTANIEWIVPCCYSHAHEISLTLDALTFRLDRQVQIGSRVVGALVLSPTDAASQGPVLDSAQRVVVARARAPRDAAVQHCLECLGS